MIAEDIVAVILDEGVFIGNNGSPRGYLGIVDGATGEVRAIWSDTLLADDHSDLGRTPYAYRWRYATNRTVPKVLWTTDPSSNPGVKTIVTDWLDKKGLVVVGHTTDLNLWAGY